MEKQSTVGTRDDLGKNASRFESFWLLYPRKVAKRHADTVWRRLSDEQRAKAIRVLPDHIRSWGGRELEMIPHAGTWLNQWRFDDELPSETRKLAVVSTFTKPAEYLSSDKKHRWVPASNGEEFGHWEAV